MKLRDETLILISAPKIRRKLGVALNDVTDQTIIRYIKDNKDNGPLTTVAALKVIKAETGLKDSEILEETPVPSL